MHETAALGDRALLAWTRARPRPVRLLVVLAALVGVLAATLGRELGVLYDEHNYVLWAATAPLGDVSSTGKPYLFYLLNYVIFHVVPDWAGPWRFLSLHVFYAALSVASVAWLSAKMTTTTEEFVWHFVVLASAPLFVINSTQVLMESAVMPAVALTVAGLIDLQRRGSRFPAKTLVCVSATVALLMKDTAAAALLVLCLAFWKTLRWQVWPLALALVAGAAGSMVMLSAVNAPLAEYGGLSSLLDLDALPSRAALTWPYASIWIFYVGPFALLAAVSLYYRRDLLRAPGARTLLWVGILSLPATFGMQLASQVAFARYAYPVLWLGVIGFAFLLLRGPRWLSAVAVAFSCIPVANMWTPSSGRLSLWPPFVANELYYSNFTILPGVPNLGWLAFAADRRKEMCILIPRENAQNRPLIEGHFRLLTEGPRFFDETGTAAFYRCDGPRAIVRREYDSASCHPECAKPVSIDTCTRQADRFVTPGYFGRPGRIILNRTCLP